MENKQKIKFIVFIIFASLFLIYRINLKKDSNLKNSNYDFYDKFLLDWTSSINKYFSQNLIFNDLFLLLASNHLDILMISFLFYFIKFGNSLRTILSLFMFYSFRGILQNLFLFSYYDSYLFDFPGFYSLVVPFYRAADFFYSGHCGCALILSLHFRNSKMNFLFFYGLFVTFINLFVMTAVTRAHYFIDVIFGLIFAFYFFTISGKICNSNLFDLVNRKFEKIKSENTLLIN